MDEKSMDLRGRQMPMALFVRKMQDERFIERKSIAEHVTPQIIYKRPEKRSSLRVLPGYDRSNHRQLFSALSEESPPAAKRPRTSLIGRPPKSGGTPKLNKTTETGRLRPSLSQLTHVDSLQKKSGKIQALPACMEPSRAKVQWDFLLEEVHWMHRLFVQERQLHIKRAAIYSREIRKYFAQKEAAQRPKTEIEQNARVEKEAKKHGAQISKMVKEFWKKANMLVDHGRKEALEAQRRRQLGNHLDFLVSEAEVLGQVVNADENIEEEADENAVKPRKTNNTHDSKEAQENLEKFAESALSFHPSGNTLATADVKVPHPDLLEGQLREYQLVGLNWLCALNEKEMNGILADEMGLGKTIQTIALFAHLAHQRNIWGPHLIVVPTSVILNWEMEFKRWCPSLKILTYFGTAKERSDKRKGWSKAGAFDVCITSYKLFTQDSRSFKMKAWQYLILDEAQHIKNFESQRWRSLMNLRTRRRLLLTGTPLQNNLMELWALLHFLMPNIFESRDDFKDWFNTPITDMIEGNIEHNQQIVQRLHKVLRPFILRRLKAEVEKQLPSKTEKVVYCELSKRQRFLYSEFMNLRSTKETMRTGSVVSVLNVVMQLRKCCNHPNLFEPRQVESPFLIEQEIRQPICRSARFGAPKLDTRHLQLPILSPPCTASSTSSDSRPSSSMFNFILDNSSSQSEAGDPFSAMHVSRRINDEIRDRVNSFVERSTRGFGIYVPGVLSQPLRQPFVDSVDNWHQLYEDRLHGAHLRNLHQRRTLADERSHIDTMMQFPETRLIEYDCGKLQMLAHMLRGLQSGGHRCLIFTQMSKMLDILQSFLAHHGYVYFRLDGSTPVEQRQVLMERFNSDERVFCFILSTRAGGVGINLTGADTVIFYDSDWNPTCDAQAQDRCHRIGQTKNVTIFRLISRSTIEENILKKAREKRRLGEIAIDEAGFTPMFFKRTDNIRDLFNTDDDATNAGLSHEELVRAERAPIDADTDMQQALASVEDQQDAAAAQRAVAEEIADAADFPDNQALNTTVVSENSQFIQLVESLPPVEQYAVKYLATYHDELAYLASAN